MSEHSVGDWFFGRTPKMRARRERTLAHPVRSAITAGTVFGLLMAASMGAAAGVSGVIVGVLSGVVFGPVLIAIIRCTKRN